MTKPFNPDHIAFARSQELQAHLRAVASQQGNRMTFAQYMALCLYQPELGYYMVDAPKLGCAGDFVTSPEISPLFAGCLSNCIQPWLARYPNAGIIEVGPGTGRLANDLLTALEEKNTLPASYHLIEISPALTNTQKNTLAENNWHGKLSLQWFTEIQRQPQPAIVLANEIIDALPVHRMRWLNGDITEQWLCLEGDTLVPHYLEVSTPELLQVATEIQNRYLQNVGHYESEINLMSTAWLATLKANLDTAQVLLFDYGYLGPAYYHPQRHMGTLMCHYAHHAHSDPFIYPGLQDITTHVDFTRLGEDAQAVGFNVTKYSNQAQFLIDNGITDLLSTKCNESDYWRHAQAAKRLLHPMEMGESFKVLQLQQGQ